MLGLISSNRGKRRIRAVFANLVMDVIGAGYGQFYRSPEVSDCCLRIWYDDEIAATIAGLDSLIPQQD